MEYVELIVDGVGVAKATGKCMTEMRSVRYTLDKFWRKPLVPLKRARKSKDGY